MLFYRFCFLIGFVCILTSAGAQSADSISTTFPKVIVKNEKNEILLIYDDNRKAYEVPGAKFEGPISFKAYIDAMAAEISIQYSTFALAGIFIYKYPNRYRTVIRPYFMVDFSGYRSDKPFDEQHYKWFSIPNAIKEIPYPASAKIVEKVIMQPKIVWGATFEEYGYTNPVDKSKIKFRVLEDFYVLH